MNGLDWSLLALAAGGLIMGYYRGFIAQLVSFAGFIVAYIVAFKLYGSLAPVLKSAFALPSYASYQKYEFLVKGLNLETYAMNALAFAILFFGVKLALTFTGRVMHVLAKAPGLNFLNRWTGALLGLAEALLVIGIAVNVMAILPFEAVQKLVSDSTGALYFINGLPAVAGKLQELWKQGL